MIKLLGKLLILLIRIYKVTLSPLIGPACRYEPTCSQYGIEAIKKHGPFKGSYLTFRRLISCHPWGGCGYDPVPDKFSFKRKSPKCLEYEEEKN